MSKLAQKMKNQLSALSTKDRAELAYYLLHSLDDSEDEALVQQAWEVELDRRWAEIESGKVKGLSADRAIAKLRKKLQ